MRIRSNHWINRQRDMVNGVQSCELDLTVPFLYNEIRDFEFFFFVAKFPDNKLESFFTTDILHLRFDE